MCHCFPSKAALLFWFFLVVLFLNVMSFALSDTDVWFVMLKPKPKMENRKKDVECFSYNLILSGLVLWLLCSVREIVYGVKGSPVTSYIGNGRCCSGLWR